MVDIFQVVKCEGGIELCLMGSIIDSMGRKLVPHLNINKSYHWERYRQI